MGTGWLRAHRIPSAYFVPGYEAGGTAAVRSPLALRGALARSYPEHGASREWVRSGVAGGGAARA